MAFTKIEQTDLIDKGVIGLPDTPGLSTAAMQAKLEETARGVIIPKHNALIDELQDVDSASSLGANPPTGRTVTNPTVQGGLNKLSDDLKVVEDGMAEAIQDAHTHANKALLDTYTQTEADLAQAVADDHTHSNKALLDTYTQSETDLADAVTKKHDHSNKALLDTYTQSETDIADAISKKHDHSNKTVLDKFGESSGQPTYDGNPIGGGGSGDTFKTITGGGQSFVASGEDTFKINAGSNVTITALSSPDKGISISATGGGSSTGDMLMNDYDRSGDVKAASSSGNGIKDFVATEIGKLDVSDSAVSGQYVSAVSETDGKISVTRASLPSIPTITDTYDGTSSNGMSGKAVKSAIDALDKSDSAVSGQYVSSVSESNGIISVSRASLPAAGHSMIAVSGDMATIAALNNGNNNYVINAYSAKRWSNCDAKIILTTANKDADGVGTWEDDSTWESGSRSGWLWSADFYRILEDGDGNRVIDTEIIPVFDVGDSETVGLLSYRIDDNVSYNGTPGGAVAFKFTGAIKSASGVKVGLKLIHQRTDVNDGTILT